MRVVFRKTLTFIWIALSLCNQRQISAHENGLSDASDPLSKAHSFIVRGQWELAEETLKSAVANRQLNSEDASVIGALGLVELKTGKTEQGEANLQRAISSHLGNSSQQFAWHLALLRSWTNKRPPEPRYDDLKKASELLIGQEVSRRLRFRLVILNGDIESNPEGALKELSRIYESTMELPAGEERAVMLLALAEAAKTLDEGASGQLETTTQLRFTALNQAIQDAKVFPIVGLEAYIELVRLYRERHKDGDALTIADQGLSQADITKAPWIRWQLFAEKGQIRKSQGQNEDALSAYTEAFDTAESIRRDFPKLDSHGQSWFKTHVAPIYLERITLLVEKGLGAKSPQARRDFLREAILTLESINRAALEDFLGHPCGVPDRKSSMIDLLSKGEKGTAFLYPLVTKDRVIVLLADGGEINGYVIRGLSPRVITQKVDALAKMLSNPESHPKSSAQELYKILFGPLAERLKRQEISRLVVIPDAVFRKLPLSALHDGSHYLTAEFNLTTLTGLSLFNPDLDDQGTKTKILVAGVSEPGAVVDHLPQSVQREISLSMRARGLFPTAGMTSTSGPGRESLQKALALQGVRKEVEFLAPFAETVLLNEEFTLEGLLQSLKDHSYSAVHIASHGIIGRNADQSFILAYDNLLQFGELESFLERGGKSGKKLGLLTLSACHTAEGDDQAPLGLSGLALRAKVPRALGSLWPVDDAATSTLMQQFYLAFSQQGLSASIALSQAQQILISNPNFEHPYYWAPFILVGQWW